MKVKLSLSIIILLFLTSCAYNASVVRTSYDALAVSQVSYDTSMKIVSDLKAKGQLSPADTAQIKTAATIYSTAHNAAVDALLTYEKSKDLSDLNALEIQLTSASTALTTLLNLIRPFIGGN